MTLSAHLTAHITANGPISVAEYMTTCLLHPTLGYYTTQEPFGTSGDFITAPEISQMFGELIGLSLVQAWMDQGTPSSFTLAELGPGRGTLMADMLRAAHRVPEFARAANISLIEASPRLQTIQKETLNEYDVTFLKDVNALPAAPLFFVANEFFDALPIRQFVRDGDAWRERMVGIDDGILSFGLGPKAPQPALSDRLDDTKDGDVVEYAPAAAPIMHNLTQRIETHGGVGLVIDYGDWRSLGDTLQAVQNHAVVTPLAHSGTADLTAHVDFEALGQASQSAYSRLTAQGVFLERLGIAQRAQMLASRLSGTALDQHIAAHRRLTHPEEMGNLFKVMGFFPSGKTPPAGCTV